MYTEQQLNTNGGDVDHYEHPNHVLVPNMTTSTLNQTAINTDSPVLNVKNMD